MHSIMLFFCLITLGSDVLAKEMQAQPCQKFVLTGASDKYEECAERISKLLLLERQSAWSSKDFLWLRADDTLEKFLHGVETGKELYVSLAFRVRPMLDGALAEMFSESLGKSIVSSPEVFLRELKKNYDAVLRLDALLGNIDPEKFEQPEEKIQILTMRRNAVEKVRNAEFDDVRKTVLDELNRQIEQWKN